MNRPWFQEDNKVDFEADGFKCAMRRGPMGAWCGYVGVSKSHPWYGKSYTDTVKPTKDMLGPRDPQDYGIIDLFCAMASEIDIEEAMPITLAVRIHGGLTYAQDHEPMGKPDGLWWFGFDCAHSGDLVPGMEIYLARANIADGGIYRDQAYVVSECQSLAAQLARIT